MVILITLKSKYLYEVVNLNIKITNCRIEFNIALISINYTTISQRK